MVLESSWRHVQLGSSQRHSMAEWGGPLPGIHLTSAPPPHLQVWCEPARRDAEAPGGRGPALCPGIWSPQQRSQGEESEDELEGSGRGGWVRAS